MKIFFLCALMALVGCSMPGVGELEERVDALEGSTGYDDAELAGKLELLEEQFTALEGLLALPADYGTNPDGSEAVRPSIDPALILDLQEALAGMTDSLSAIGGDIRSMGDSLSVLNGDLADLADSLDASRESLDELTLSVDSLTAENEEMKENIEDLQGSLWSIQQANQQEMGTSGRPSGGSTGDRDSGGGSTGGRDTGGGSSGR